MAGGRHCHRLNVQDKVIEDMGKWSNAWANQDIVDPNYIFPVRRNSRFRASTRRKTRKSKGTLTRLITMPLPPLLLKDWGMEAAHPKIRLNIPEDAAATPGVNHGATSPDLGFGGSGRQSRRHEGATARRHAGPALRPRTAAAHRTPPPVRCRRGSAAAPGYGTARAETITTNVRVSAAVSVHKCRSTHTLLPRQLRINRSRTSCSGLSISPSSRAKHISTACNCWLMNPNFGLKPECLENAKCEQRQMDQIADDRADAAGHRAAPVSNSRR